MGESNTVVSAYTLYRHLQQYCSHPLICAQHRERSEWTQRVALSLIFINCLDTKALKMNIFLLVDSIYSVMKRDRAYLFNTEN